MAINQITELTFTRNLPLIPYHTISSNEHINHIKMNKTKYLKILNHYVDKGFINYGTSINFWWLTDTGVKHIKDFWNKMEELHGIRR